MVREPLRQSKADLSRAKDTLINRYEFPNLLRKRLHSSAMSPVVVKTKGVKVPCSTSKTLFAYNLFLSHSFLR